MSEFISIRLAIALLVALAPLPIGWLVGRRRLRDASDPALAERVFGYRNTLAKITAVALALTIVFGEEWAPLLMLLCVVAAFAGAYPARKRLFGEAWSMSEYVEWQLRMLFGYAGFWIALFFLPALVIYIGREQWIWVFLVMLLWEHFYGPILRFSVGAEPLSDPALRARFDELAAKARCAKPNDFAGGPRNGNVANALALPKRRGNPAVLISHTLLRELTEDELAAIYAHELAHLEHYSPKMLRKFSVVATLALLFASLLTPFCYLLDPNGYIAIGFALFWPIAGAFALGQRHRRHQSHESESDIRAVELCGDPEALIRGLTKVHELGQLPRRFDHAMEKSLSHPSLSRRIQAIRERAGIAPPPLSDELIVASRDDGAYVVFSNEETLWLTGVPNTVTGDAEALRVAAQQVRVLRYGDTKAMHIRIVNRGHALIARDLGGVTRTLPLRETDIEAVQRRLDSIDVQFAR